MQQMVEKFLFGVRFSSEHELEHWSHEKGIRIAHPKTRTGWSEIKAKL